MRSRSRGVRSPLPWVVWRAHLARSQHWALVGPFHVVRAPPRVLPRSLAPSGVLGGGAVRCRFPPTWLGVVGVAERRPRGGCLPLLPGAYGVRRSPSPDCPPTGRAVGVRYPRAVGAGVLVWGPYSVPVVCAPCGGCVARGGSVAFMCRGAGWGRASARCPPFVRPGGACRAGGRSASFRPSAFPGQATKWVSLASFCPWGCGPPYNSGSCSPAFTGGDLCGVLARWRGLACSPRFLRETAAGAGGQAALRLLSRAGGGGTISLPRGVGAGAPAACGPVGGSGGGGRATASLLPLWVAARGIPSWHPSGRLRTPLRRARAVGVAEPPRLGGDAGRPVDRSPGGP